MEQLEKQKIMYAFNDDSKWKKVILDAEEMADRKAIIDKIAIIAMGAAILSILIS